MSTTSEKYIYGELVMPHWGVSVPAAISKADRKERYVPFRLMCGILGVDRKTQLKIVKVKYARSLKPLPLETSTGLHDALWMRCPECALWIGDIDPARCKISARGPLEQFQKDFSDAADKLLFEGPKTPTSRRGIIASSERHEYVFSCLYCGGTHRIITQDGEVEIERYVVQ